ncbi:MAG: chromate transporter [Betaproteobacteria bacterium]|nr:chromate transporter [Betaproteobacteria bacterium]
MSATLATPLVVPTLRQLFTAYLVVGATGFGGSVVWLRRMLVEKNRWLAADDFNDALSLSQFLPGPMVFNFIVVIGRHLHGLPGILVSSFALMLMPFIFALILGSLYNLYGQLPAIQGVLRGIAPVAAGLLLSLGCKTAMSPILRSPLAIMAILTFAAAGIFRVSLPMVMLIIAPLSILLAASRKR